jgi:hypothetical protein
LNRRDAIDPFAHVTLPAGFEFEYQRVDDGTGDEM